MYKWILLSVVVGGVISSAVAGAAETGPLPLPKKPVTATMTTVAGNEVSIPVEGKKATVIVFVTTDCPIANTFAPALQRIQKEFGEKGVAFFRVYPDASQSIEDIKAHTKEFSYNADAFPAIRDADEQELVKKTGARVTPEAVVITPKGEVKYRGRVNNLYSDIGRRRREPTQHDLRDALDAVLGEKKIAEAITRPFGCFIPLEFEEKETNKDAAEGSHGKGSDTK